tara:strand:+ start:1437 stop:2141 length:705 start_codon:yes stop_codon:yes gene_type:complete
MATVKEYGYYIEGSRISIVQKDTAFDNDVNSRDYGPGSNRSQWKSPLETVEDGLQIQYATVQKYFIETTNDVDQNLTQYQSTDGYLSIADNSSAYTNYVTTYALAADKYIVLKRAGRFNGLHKIKAISNNTGTNNKITLYTRYRGSEAAWTNFEEVPKLYYAVDVLDDEDDTIDLNTYLSKALVYYVKAKVAEDMVNMELKEYWMKEFRRMVEKHENSRIAGVRMQSSGPYAIR